MRVFDVPAGVGPNDRPVRIVVHGTCRVHDPFEAMAAAGRIVKIWANYAAVSHTFGEARQMLAHCLGHSPIPAALQPFVFDTPANAPPPEPVHRRIIESADAYLFEISGPRQIRYGNAYFQIQAFNKNFIFRHGNALLPWYRLFAQRKPASEAVVADTMSKLSHLSSDEQEVTAGILREAQLESTAVPSGTDIVSELAGDSPWRWTFVPNFLIPGVSNTMMAERKTVRQIVSEVAVACGVGYFDPSALVARYGPEKTLENGGKDPCHYNPAFHMTTGRALLQEPLAKLSGHEASPLPAGTFSSAGSSVSLVGAALNTALISLHRERVSRLGVDGSGLHAHYAAMMERRTLLNQVDLEVAEIVANFLPRFERYDVLQSGLGELAFLLSAFGCRTRAFDPFRTRNDAIEAGIEHLRDCRFPNSERLGSELATVPELTGSENALAVAYRLAVTLSPEDQETMLRRLEKYPAVLFNPATLIRARPLAADQDALVERFQRAGFRHTRDFPRFGLLYCAKEAPYADFGKGARSPLSPLAEEKTSTG